MTILVMPASAGIQENINGDRMKALPIILCGLLIFTLQAATANGSTSTSPRNKPYYKMDPAIKHHARRSWNVDRMLVVTLYPGSLKANIVRIARNCGWNTVVWNVPEDYTWVGRTQISAPNLPSALFKILAKYPVQAQFYQGNRVLAIVPRNLP